MIDKKEEHDLNEIILNDIKKEEKNNNRIVAFSVRCVDHALSWK